MIQTALREQLDPSITVITVAHRLTTIKDYDKVVCPIRTTSGLVFLLISMNLACARCRFSGEWRVLYAGPSSHQ